MRIAYVCHWDLFVDDGVTQKIRSQVGVWRAKGADVKIFAVSHDGLHGGPPALAGEQFLYTQPLFGRGLQTVKLARAVKRWNADLLYLRYTPLLPPPRGLLAALPTVVEINSDDREEYRSKSKAQIAFNDLSRRVVFRYADGFACVTQELLDNVVPAGAGKRTLAVTNGIYLDGFDIAPAASNARPRLAFLLGSPAPWHGLDKVLALASALPEFDFDLVGCGPSDAAAAPPNVFVHSFMTPPEFRRILAHADVGIGTLALHRKGMSEAAPLKVREYLAQGIPVIVGFRDPDLDDNPWFALSLPNTEANVAGNIQRIREFVRAVAGRRIPRAETIDRVDIVLKEGSRMQFLEHVAAIRRP